MFSLRYYLISQYLHKLCASEISKWDDYVADLRCDFVFWLVPHVDGRNSTMKVGTIDSSNDILSTYTRVHSVIPLNTIIQIFPVVKTHMS